MKSIDAAGAPRPRPSPSEDGAVGGTPAGGGTSALRERFDRHLPKYGSLWRSMARAAGARPAAGKENALPVPVPGAGAPWGRGEDWPGGGKDPGAERDAGSDPGGPDLLGAILGGRAVSLRVGQGGCAGGCDSGCECAAPIVELLDDEDASAFDGGDLDDTDDEGDAAGVAGTRASGGGPGGGRGAAVPVDALTPCGSPDAGVDDDDDSVVIVRRTPGRRTYVIESDDDSDGETIGSDDSDDVDGSSVYDEETDGSHLFASDEEDAATPNETSKPKACSLVESDGESGADTAASGTGGLSGVDDADSDAESQPTEVGDADGIGRREKSALRGSGAATGGSGVHRVEREQGRSPVRADQMRSNADEDEGSESSSEEEWVELSSDEEDEEQATPPRLENTVVILSSDDEEESDDDDDDRSVFTVSDDEDEDDVPTSPKAGGSARGSGTGGRPSRPAGRRPAPKEGAKPGSRRGKPGSTAKTFRRERDALLSRTFAEFDRRAFDGALSSVEVTWSNRLNTTAGVARLRGRTGPGGAPVERTARIELATKVIDDEDRLRSTLLHEMCHAAQWLVDGTHKPPHGKCFKKWAAISMRRIRDVEVTTTHDCQIAYKYAWACTNPKCDVVVKRHSRSVDPTRQCCGRCKGRLVEIDVPGRDPSAGEGYTPRVRRAASGFALFVKERSSRVREDLAARRSCAPGEVTQADVMRECGRLWRIQKSGGSSSGEGGGGRSEGGDDGLESTADRLVQLTLDGDGSP